MNAAEMLAKYRIPSDLIVAADIRHATDCDVRELLGVHGRAGQDLGGFVFPYRDPRHGRVLGHRVRLDQPIDGQKYLSMQGCRTLFFAPIQAEELTDTSIVAVISRSRKICTCARCSCQSFWTKDVDHRIRRCMGMEA